MSDEELQPIKGMSDLGPPDIQLWQQLESSARDVLQLYGFQEVRTPIVEKAAVFVRSLGDGTDVVQKEMYTLTSRDGKDQYAIRPEGTAGVIRYVASLGQEAQGARFYYLGPMFRGERPQKGRRRQFHQLGAEAIGPSSPASDAEMIALHAHLLRNWGLKDFRISLNTRGLPEDRLAVQQGLSAALAPHAAQLCEECQRRLQANVLRVLDCKNEACKAIVASVPPVTAFMAPESRACLDEVVRLLRLLELEVTVNPALVRGLDYYLHTVWEIAHPALGAQDAIAGGGRYRLTFGGREVEGVGFAIGLERAIMAVQHDVPAAPPARRQAAWIVSLGDRAFEENLRLLQTLRQHGVASGMDLGRRSMKAQMRAADRSLFAFVVVRGDSELDKGTFMLKDLGTGQQVEVELPELIERLRPRVVSL